jgi:transcriptional regulator with XRE-family HTH domain
MERAHVSRLEQARLERGWTREHLAEKLEVEPITVRRWEKGQHRPQPIHRQQLCMLYGKTPRELGLEEDSQDGITSHMLEKTLVLVSPEYPIDAYTAFRKEDLTTRLQSLIWSWLIKHDTNARYQELQEAIILELEDNSMQDHVISRREALRRLASLPVEYCFLSLSTPVLVRPVEEILAYCAAGITACWRLRKGEDLAFALDTVMRYIPTLQEIVTTGREAERKTAADLLAQCFVLKSHLSNHLGNNSLALNDARQAEQFSIEADNLGLQIIAVRAQANAYDYANHWEQALKNAKKAKYLFETNKGTPIPMLLASHVYAGLANYQGHTGQKQDALRTLGQAHITFFTQSPDMPTPVWIPHGHGSLLLHDGLTHFHLGLYKQACDSFARVGELPGVSATTRIEALITRVMAEVQRDDSQRDMDLCIALWTEGMRGAIAMQSEQWFNDALIAYTAMSSAWPGEKRIKALRELIAHW